MDAWERGKGLAPLSFHVHATTAAAAAGACGGGGGVIEVGAAELVRSLLARYVRATARPCYHDR